MNDVQVIRRRNGAARWELYHDIAEPERFLETFVVPSWAEHLRQLDRLTIADQSLEERALALQQPGTMAQISHFLGIRESNGHAHSP